MTSPSVTGCWRCGASITLASQYCGACGASQTASGGVGDDAARASTTDPLDELLTQLAAATVGEYTVIRPLGRGGQATVFLATELALGRRVAIKVMSPDIMSTPGMIERFYAEAATQANLAHANIVAVYAVRRSERLNFFTMQYVAGRSLQQAMRASHDAGRHLEIDVVRSVLYQVGSALGYAHRRGVIHRDVKPGNVMLTAAGESIVTDFGIAKVLTSESLTMTGAIFGTAIYMSPEQCNAERPTGASDQYSLGIMAYEMLTGAPPFSGSAFAMMHAHTMQVPAPISLTRPDCPPEVERAVMRMLAKTPGERFADVESAIDAMGARPVPQSPDDPMRRRLIDFAVGDLQSTSIDDLVRVPVSPSPRSRSSDGRPRTGDPSVPPAPSEPASSSPRSQPPAFQPAPLGASALIAPDPREEWTPVAAPTPVRGPATGAASGTNGGAVASGADKRSTATLSARPWWQGPAGRGAMAAVAVALVAFVAVRLSNRPGDERAAAGGGTVDTARAPSGGDTAVAPAESTATGGDEPGKGDPVSVPVTIDGPPRVTLPVAGTLQLQLTAAAGASGQNAELHWQSRRPGIAAVDSMTGMVTARRAGEAIVVARTSTGVDSVRVSVVPKAPLTKGSGERVSVVAKPESVSVRAGAGGTNERRDSAGPVVSVVPPKTNSASTTSTTPDAAPTLDALVDQCHFALSSANEGRVDELFGRGGNDAARDLRNALKARPTVGAVSDRAMVREGEVPVAEFTVPITWQNNFGAMIKERYVIRARATLTGGAWKPLGCLVVSRARIK